MKSGTITAVHRDNKQKQRYHIDLNEEYAFSVHEDILVKYNLFKGTEVDEAFFHEVLVAEEKHRAYLGALRYLGFRPRTKSQLNSYLIEKGFLPSIAEEVCERCQEQGYIDDEAFARQWVDERLRLKPRSPYMLRMELQQRGVERGIVEDAVRAVSREDELIAARALIEKKAKRLEGAPNPDEERKLLSMLMRKGFSHGVIQQIRGELRQRTEE
ncbi:RecX family transcriptional regulator [Brevibacillus centrosporus]|uniref:RecX family transcriptional regulator n=1 Tax=Brevibacillus centrosporus TaxID=54910 RepID=UPI002E1E216E|nr:RecX family transcriptional regulator [Brevibacillus centrosporus]MED1949241.1 RecX family transcriptional regulator [Brevibacillus centrosporus]